MADQLEPDLAPGGLVFLLEAHDGLELDRVRCVDGVAHLAGGAQLVEAVAARHAAYVETYGGRALVYDGDTGVKLATLTAEGLEGTAALRALAEAAEAEAAALEVAIRPVRLAEDGPL